MDKKTRFQDRYTLQRIEDCRRIYAKYGGRQHEQIEREMRALGHATFHRRLLYSRFERGRHAPGWVEKYSFDLPVAGNAAALGCNAGSSGVTKLVNDQLDQAESTSASRSGTLAGEGACVPGLKARRKTFGEFHDWLKFVSPNYDWDFKHQVYLYKTLRDFDAGIIKRLMIWMPPRHGKSEMVTVRHTAWELRNDPSKNIIVASYTQRLANRFSRKIKGVLADDWALSEPPALAGGKNGATDNVGRRGKAGRGDQVTDRRSTAALLPPAHAGGSDDRRYENGSPFPFASRRRANSDAEWETSMGGGLRAVGVGGGVTGFGADTIMVDDPIKSRAEAESAVYRDRVWNWFNDDIYTRLEPDGKVCIIQTRWHEDDLCGRLLREEAEGGEKWTVVNLPALAEGGNWSAGIPAFNADPPGVTKLDNDRLERSENASASRSGTLAGEGSCVPGVKPRVIGYPRLYSKHPSWTGGVAAASADGVVDELAAPHNLHTHETRLRNAYTIPAAVNHPGPQSRATPPVQEGNQEKLPSWTGGVAAASADGVVDELPAPRNAHMNESQLQQTRTIPTAVNHPGPQSRATPPVKEGNYPQPTPPDPLDRAPGEALWPERFSADLLHRIKKKLGSYSFGSLYQQRPVPADGGLFKRGWFKIIPRAPHGLRWRRATDPGLTSNAKADYTASFRVAFDSENNMYIDGGFRKQLEYPELRRFVLGRMQREHDTLEHGVERSAHGRALEQDLGRERSAIGKPLLGVDVRDGKIPRALPWIALAEQGKVFLTRAAWNRDFIDECLAFPLGTHDDQIDAVSLGVQMSRKTNNKLFRF